MQVFLDMDGVLADFDRGYFERFGVWPDKEGRGSPQGYPTAYVDWNLVRSVPDFYAELPPMADMSELIEGVERLGHLPYVLTGVPSSIPGVAEQKRQWVKRHLGHDRVYCCASKDKRDYLRAPGDVLIDDWEKHRHLWEGAGGRWITHSSAAESLLRLEALRYYRYWDPVDPLSDPIQLQSYEIARRTERGVWLYEWGPDAPDRLKFVLDGDSGKRFAYPTLEAARRSYVARKKRAVALSAASHDRQAELLRRVDAGDWGLVPYGDFAPWPS